MAALAAVPDATAAPASAAADVATLLAEPGARHWYRSAVLWVGLAAALLAALGLWWWQSSRAANAAPSYTTQPVALGNLTLSVTANGTLQPTRSISIGSELSGTVLKVNVDVNDSIKKGQVLVVLNTAKLRDQILRSQASVASAQGRLSQTAATVRKRAPAWHGWRKWRGCRAARCRRAPNSTAAAPRRRALADESSARAGVADARAALSTDQINLSKASIVSPADGLVLTRSVDPGNAVAASLQAVTLFTVAEDLAKLRLWVYVDEADNFNIFDTQQLAETLSNTTELLTTLLGAVAAASLLVGGIGIMNIMLVSVTERTREIGLRLAVGALEGEVLLPFLIEAVVLSALGGVVGIAIATAASYGLSIMMAVPYAFDPAINLLSLLFSAAIGVVFGYFPARRAAQMDPIEALRHE